MSPLPELPRVVLVTGPSGAGRSTAINVLEDLGFEAIDNIPVGMIPRLFDGGPIDRPLALGIDVRNRDFSASGLIDLHSDLSRRTDGRTALLFLDSRPDVLVRRYSETRRRHPLAQDGTPDGGIARERDLLQPVRDRADIVIDTSLLSPHDLKAEMHTWFADSTTQTLSVVAQSFSYKRGIPHGVDMVLDCRFLSNPHWDTALREKTGLDEDVQRFVRQDERLSPFVTHITSLLSFLLPEMEAEGKTHLSIGMGCTGGQHRSVVVAEEVARALAEGGWQVSIAHKELERRRIVAEGGASLPNLGKVAE